MDNDELVKRLSFENLIWITFIIVSIADIYGDELIKKSIKENDDKSKLLAKNIFLLVGLTSILVYIYFLYRNFIDYKKYNNKYYEIRFIGSILILIGTSCLIYFQLYNEEDIELPSNV